MMMGVDHGPLVNAITPLVSLGLGIARLSVLVQRDGLRPHHIHSRLRRISLCNQRHSNQHRPATQRHYPD